VVSPPAAAKPEQPYEAAVRPQASGGAARAAMLATLILILCYVTDTNRFIIRRHGNCGWTTSF
jgi:hypothetical protein